MIGKKEQRVLFNLLLLGVVFAPLASVQHVSSGDQGGAGDARGYKNTWYSGWPFASAVCTETIYFRTGTRGNQSTQNLTGPRFANTLICICLGLLTYVAWLHIFKQLPRFSVLDFLCLVSGACVTATYTQNETSIFHPTFNWPDFEHSSLHWVGGFIQPIWLKVGIATYLTLATFALLRIIVTLWKVVFTLRYETDDRGSELNFVELKSNHSSKQLKT